MGVADASVPNKDHSIDEVPTTSVIRRRRRQMSRYELEGQRDNEVPNKRVRRLQVYLTTEQSSRGNYTSYTGAEGCERLDQRTTHLSPSQKREDVPTTKGKWGKDEKEECEENNE